MKSALRPIRPVLVSSVRGRGRELGRLAAWSTVQALPAFLSGRLIAQAIDQGFLAHRTATGFAWLGVFAASVLVGAWGTRQTFLRLAVIVEPFRDELARLAVTTALRRSTVPGASADTAGVARLSQQVEIAREAYGSLLLIVQISLVTTGSALLGLLTLAPTFLVLVLPPVVVGLGLFMAALPRMAARQRMSILADERIAETGSALAGGLRDVVACGAEERVAATVGREIDAQARATREVARFTALRTVSVALGGWLPIVLILVAGPWLLRHGATTGTILGALTYVAQGVQPALRNLVGGLGNMGLWLVVALVRIVEATGLPGDADEEERQLVVVEVVPGPLAELARAAHHARLRKLLEVPTRPRRGASRTAPSSDRARGELSVDGVALAPRRHRRDPSPGTEAVSRAAPSERAVRAPRRALGDRGG